MNPRPIVIDWDSIENPDAACAAASNICNNGLQLRTEIYKRHFTPDDDLDVTQIATDV